MRDPKTPDPVPESASDEPENEKPLDAALRAAFGPDTTAFPHPWEGGGVLAALKQVAGVSSQVMLRDEPGAAAPVVNTRATDPILAPGGPGRYQVLGEIARGG